MNIQRPNIGLFQAQFSLFPGILKQAFEQCILYLGQRNFAIPCVTAGSQSTIGQ